MRGSLIHSCCVILLCCWSHALGAQQLCLHLKPMFGTRALQPGKQHYMSPGGDSLSIETFRFYISGIRLWHKGKMVYAENESYHLIDAEDSGSQKIVLTVPELTFDALSFAIGVDSLANVSGAMGGDLDPLKAMYWAWHSGYINAKLEGHSLACPTRDHVFEFHIGGYAAPYASLRGVKLGFAERRTTKESPSQLWLRADAACWFQGLDLKTENSILNPSPGAMRMADRYQRMFSITEAP